MGGQQQQSRGNRYLPTVAPPEMHPQYTYTTSKPKVFNLQTHITQPPNPQYMLSISNSYLLFELFSSFDQRGSCLSFNSSSFQVALGCLLISASTSNHPFLARLKTQLGRSKGAFDAPKVVSLPLKAALPLAGPPILPLHPKKSQNSCPVRGEKRVALDYHNVAILPSE